MSSDSTELKYPKTSEIYWLLSTGALKAAKINNIYDMAGNLYEWTMEGYNTVTRVYRGGYFENTSDSSPISYRTPNGMTAGNGGCGFRVALYIKI